MAETATQSVPLKQGPDQTLTIEQVLSSVEVANKKGGDPHHRFKVIFKEAPGIEVQMFITSFEKWEPKPGASVTGTVSKHESFGWQFERKRQGGPGRGFAGRSPEENARIQRQHSQDMAIQFMRFAHERGIVRGTDEYKELVEELLAVADSFDKDIIAGAKRALAQSTRVDSGGGNNAHG